MEMIEKNLNISYIVFFFNKNEKYKYFYFLNQKKDMNKIYFI